MDRREQENPAPKKELDKQKHKYACPKCGADLTNVFVRWLNEISGTKNGDLKELGWKLKVGEITMGMVGIKLTEGEVSEKVLQRIEGIITRKLSEQEKEIYEKKIENLRKLMEEKLQSRDLIIKQLELSKKDLMGKEVERLNQTIEGLRKVMEGEKEHSRQLLQIERDRVKELQERYKNMESAYNELETKVISNPALKGIIAQSDLKEDLEGCFPDQQGCFADISKKGYGDLFWSIRINVGKQWIDSGISATIDSKDKTKITENDLEKLRRDMRFNKSIVGMIITNKQDQLRLKEFPTGIYESEEGYILVVAREDSTHHIIIKFVRDILARMLYESSKKEKRVVDISKLNTILNDLTKCKEYHRKIKSKAKGIIRDVEDEESYVDLKLKEAWKVLEPTLVHESIPKK